MLPALPVMSTQTTSILLIEDDQPLLESLKAFLEDQGFETHTAGTRAAGEEVLRRLHPSICLLDLNLPDGSGVDLLRLIVTERLSVKVIVMTAFPVAHLKIRFPAAVLSAVLTKPVSPEQLIEAVDRIARNGES